MKVRKGQKSFRIPKKVYMIERCTRKDADKNTIVMLIIGVGYLDNLRKRDVFAAPNYIAIDMTTRKGYFWPVPDRAYEVTVQYLPQPEEF